ADTTATPTRIRRLEAPTVSTRASSRPVPSKIDEGRATDSTPGLPSDPPAISTATALTSSSPGGTVNPSSAEDNGRTPTATRSAAPPGAIVSSSPVEEAAVAPSGPATVHSSASAEGARSATEMMPPWNASGSKVCDGETTYDAPSAEPSGEI